MRTHLPGNVRMLSVSVTAGMCKPCVARFHRYSLLVVFEKKQHDRINTREETIGETRGRREQVIACTMIEEAHAAAGEKMASICQWGGLSGNISDAFAGVPCLTPRGPHAS